MLIHGKYATAVCYASVIEDDAVEQIRRMCDHEFTKGSHISIMPDVHAGKGCTIGTTMTVIDKVVPNIVGVDIGCGMYTIRLNEKVVDFARIDEAAHFIPSGKNVWESNPETFDFEALRCCHELKSIPRLQCSLGTLGGGNHFIEVDRGSDGALYLVIHTGSRNLGTQVANYYQKLAVELHSGKEKFFRQREALIAEYKAAGRLMSCTVAKKSISIEEYAKAMEGIYTTCVGLDTLDEAPMAYKSIDNILDDIKESVDVIDILKPVYNFKASE